LPDRPGRHRLNPGIESREVAMSEEMGRPADPDGPFDTRIDVPVSEDTKIDAAMFARASGHKSVSEWVRRLIHRELYGEMRMIERYLHRVRNSMGGKSE
jgi:hypothetical protein